MRSPGSNEHVSRSPLAPCTAQRNQHLPSGPKAPPRSTLGSRWQQWRALECNGVRRDPFHMGTQASANQHPGLRRHARRFQWGRALRGTRTEAFGSPRLAGARLGCRRSETGSFEVGFRKLARARRGHEALSRDAGDRTSAVPAPLVVPAV
jgi:hypothetical protein